jgi:hypothetical protein
VKAGDDEGLFAFSQTSLAHRGFIKVTAMITAHPTRAEFARVRHLSYPARVFAVSGAVIVLNAALDAFFVMSSESA